MLPTVPVPPRRLDEYREVAGEDAVERLRDTAALLAGARVLHISPPAFGGGVAELLLTQVGLMNDLGIEATWQVLETSEWFAAVTKFLHSGLQGADVPWDDEMIRIYEDHSRTNAELAADGIDHDIVLVHDPRAAAILTMLGGARARARTWMWRCHLDLSAAYPPVWSYLARHIEGYDASVFTLDEFIPPGFEGRVFVVQPSIDPLSARNQWMDPDTIYEILHRFGVQWTRPIATQVGPFDPWRDPIGVIEAYRLARNEVPDLQLVLIATTAHEDPEGWHYLELTERVRAGDPNVVLLSDIQGVGNLEINAFQRDSNVVLQKSIREGFGLTVAEAMWKGTPVVGGDVGGIRLQIEDGVSGFLVDSVEACAARMVQVIRDDELAERLSRAGRRGVRDRFLALRELGDLLTAMAGAAEAAPAAS